MSDSPNWGAPHYRDALLRRARTLGIDPRVRVRFDAEDVASETLARAVAAQVGTSPFAGTSEGERLSYLFTIQSRVLQDLYDRHLGAEKRSVRREQDAQAFNQALTESLDGLANIAINQTSVSEKASQNEQDAWLAAAIQALPERERQALTLRRENRTLEEIAAAMDITAFAAGGLITRATQRLRDMRPAADPEG